METKDIILKLRNEHKLTQDELAEKIFVTRQAVSKWENGEPLPNTDTLKQLSKTFNGSLLKIIENVQDTAERMNDTSAIIDTNSWKRIETKSYPGKSLREIILNAFCHANYFIRSNIKVEFLKIK